MTDRRNRMYDVPSGYFEGLQQRLSAIPAMDTEAVESHETTFWMKVRPVIALAASFAVMLTCGTVILNTTAGKVTEGETDYFEYAYAIVPVTEPYSIYDESLAESLYPSLSEDDIENYLIETGVSVNQIGYVEYYE